MNCAFSETQRHFLPTARRHKSDRKFIQRPSANWLKIYSIFVLRNCQVILAKPTIDHVCLERCLKKRGVVSLQMVKKLVLICLNIAGKIVGKKFPRDLSRQRHIRL